MATAKPARIDRAEQPSEIIANIEANVRFASQILAEIAECDPSVSKSFTLGIQFSPTDIRISGPHETPPDQAWTR
jgi:hypothetical protein